MLEFRGVWWIGHALQLWMKERDVWKPIHSQGLKDYSGTLEKRGEMT